MSKKKSPIQAVNRTKKKVRTSKKRFPVALFIIGMTIVAIICFVLFYSQSNKPLSPSKFRKQVPKGFASIGIDVSHHQGEMDWDKLFNKSGYDSLIQFVYCKATEGNTHIDTQWEKNRNELNDLGISNGAYHFFIPYEDPLPQAEHFLNHWKKREIDLPPVLDVETEGISDKDMISKIKIWLEKVEEITGMRPIIYTSLHFYETKFQNVFLDYKFWVAAYSRKPKCINDERIIHWQFSEKGRIPGTKEKVDLNVSKLIY